MNKIYREVTFNFMKALNKAGFRTNARSFISMRSVDKIISLLFEVIFDKLEKRRKSQYQEFLYHKED